MITQIRRSIFETNSSSTHSLSIDKGVGLLDTSYDIDGNGSIMLQPKEFGWEQAEYHDFGSKASYLWIYIKDWVNDTESSEKFKQMFEQVIKNQTGAVSVEMNSDEDDDWSPDGYIDHQSVEDRDLDYLFESPEILHSFLFNRTSKLNTDNDNH